MFASSFEQENKSFKNRKTAIAFTATTVIHVGLILLLLFTILRTPIPPFEDNAGGMSVNFGTDDVGTGDEQPFTYNPGPTEAEPAPAQSQPQTSAPENILSQENEENDIVAPKVKEKPAPKINDEAVLKPNQKPNTKTTTTKNTKSENTTQQPQVNKDAMFEKGAKGNPNNSKGDGTGGGQGDQGKPNGDPNSKNYEGDGDGDGEGPGKGDLKGGFSLKGRVKVILPAPVQCSSQGKVVITIKVNQEGKVTDAVFKRFSSNVFDDCNVKNALAAARKATFNPDPNAPEVQEGTITYIYKVQ